MNINLERDCNMAWRLHDDIYVSIAYQGNNEEAATSEVYTILEQKVADF